MAAVWYRFRVELRTRWAATLGLALLVGLAGGVVFTALAGARRTDTSYDRMVEETRAWDVLVLPDQGNDSALDPQDVARLPMVESFGYMPAMALVPAGADSLEELFNDLPIAFAGPDGAALFEIGRPNVLEGRLPDPDVPEEVLLDTTAADELELGAGDSVEAFVLTFDDLVTLEAGPEVLDAYRRGELGEPVHLTVTGVGITPDALVVDEGFELPVMVVTPAFYEQHADSLLGFWGGMARLERGSADEAEFRTAVEALVPEETVEFQSGSRVAATVDRAVRPYVVALELFAAAIAVTGLLVIGQALARQRFLDAADDTSLESIGFTRVQMLVVAALRTGIVAIGGALLAVSIAIVGSSLMPIGPARQAEPHSGVAFDAVVLGTGAVTLVVLVLVLGVVPAWRLARARPRLGGGGEGAATRPSPVPAALGRLGMGPVAVTGVRFALETGRGRTAVPARTTVVGAIGAVVTVAAALTFAASLDHLLGTPRLYGINYDARLTTSVESEEERAELAPRLEAELEADGRVVAWSKAELSRVQLEGRNVPAIGLEMIAGSVAPTVVSGRIPAGDDEIALGTRTLGQLGVDVGETVTATFGSSSRELAVVGRVVLPGAGNYPGGDKTSIGDGALLTRAGLADLAPLFEGTTYLVRFADGVDEEAALADVAGRFGPMGDVLDAAGVEQPADIVDYERVRATPLVLAGMLALLGVATVTHALVTTVRRRRRDLAVLKTLGFTRLQVSGAVAWQATTVAAIALVVGLPIGIAGGRFAWALLAEEVGTIPEPVTPFLVVLVSIPVVLIVINLVAAAPGWLAGRVRPGAALRSE